ncbi:MAG TPA: FMN-binding negative transcriptional regulator [Chitinophagaceae bacterium]|nr:FMN-binding negative transcriptional regulator [Chitinophagaceae bacterium]
MYNLPYFKEKDQQVILDFIRQHPFAFMAGCSKDSKPVATQIPMFIDERNGKLFLSGHMMKNTDHHKAFLHNPNVLAVFTGAHTYVSASWYEDKKQGSTWNYISVHAKGILKFLDERALLDVLKRTTNHFENNAYSGANFEDLPAEYVQSMAKAIIAFEVEVLQIDNVFKLSQNRDEKSYHNIMEKLEAQNADGKYIAEEMKKRTSQLFKEK